MVSRHSLLNVDDVDEDDEDEELFRYDGRFSGAFISSILLKLDTREA